eukprot:TRINITY_DN3651_c0_g1_i1.p1 TRINITY_DN3651_c0_g1~~TRINITY_DN3651_c0_g1_i1.p1  ORF type:complete len:240 (-),score=60.54 TRINITY_DN3651_c0_g1_i1:69-788(-)
MGKTQFCLMLSLLATLPKSLKGLDGSVIYYDTEGSFNVERLVQIARTKFSDYYQSEEHRNQSISRIQIVRTTKSSEIVASLEKLEGVIIENNVKLIILDSVGSMARNEFSSENFIERSNVLVKLASLLKSHSERFRIPVMVTNQVMEKMDPFSKKSHITPALGPVWAHSVNNRLILETSYGNKRKITIAKSPISPVVSFPYHIREDGIAVGDPDVPQSDVEVELNPDNYWNQQIFAQSV